MFLSARRITALARIKPRNYAVLTNNVFIKPHKPLIVEQTEYKQLPDDSQYIEKYYHELAALQSEIVNNKAIRCKNFSEFETDPNYLIEVLENFINEKILHRYKDDNSLGSQLVIERYLQFLENVKITLLLNGGHSFVFDILLQNKKLFDKFDDKVSTEKNRKK